MKFEGTPFIGYRYEDIHSKLSEYFIQPQCYEALTNTRPTIIEGSRGFGKTTLLQSIEYHNNHKYLGVYMKINDNITSLFDGGKNDETVRIRLFSCYFVLTLSYQMANLACYLDENYSVNTQEILKISNRFFKKNANSLNELLDIIYYQKNDIIDYINNGMVTNYPYICNYSELIKAFPQAIISSCEAISNKTIYYLIDEFESLNSLQQKCVLGFLKQHDIFHTFKIATKPWGITEYKTVGGQEIQLVHDYELIDLAKYYEMKRSTKNESFVSKSFFDFAHKVCNRRIEKYLKEYDIHFDERIHGIEHYLEEISYEDELNLWLKSPKNQKDINHYKSLTNNQDIIDFLSNVEDNPLDYCIFRLYLQDNTIENSYSFIRRKDEQYINMRENYKMAFLFNLSKGAQFGKYINGFKDMVNYSGGNIRYLLEFLNQLFVQLKMKDDYSCKSVSIKKQTDAVRHIAQRDLDSIRYLSNVLENEYLKQDAGMKIRSMMVDIGRIFRIIHLSPKISVIEANHFVLQNENINDSFVNHEALNGVLRECIINGYLIAYENNKRKSKEETVINEYMYKLHPLYCALFGISWRRKNNIALKDRQFAQLIIGRQMDRETVIKSFENKYNSQNDNPYQFMIQY